MLNGKLTIRNGNGASKNAYIEQIGTNASSTDIVFYNGVNVFSSNGSFEIKNAAGIGLLISPAGIINLTNVPLSSVGLVSGDLYQTAGVLNIVP